MQRNKCQDVQDSFKVAAGGLLELHNRDFETGPRFIEVLKERGLTVLTIPAAGPVDVAWLDKHAQLGFWILTGPTEEGPMSTVMLGRDFYHRPKDIRYLCDVAEGWLITVFIPFNPMFVRRHECPEFRDTSPGSAFAVAGAIESGARLHSDGF